MSSRSPSPEPADQRHRRDVVRRRELVSVDARQLLGERPRRSRLPAIDLPVRDRGRDGFRQRLQDRRRRIHPARRDLPDVDDDVLRERVHESGIRPGDQDQVRRLRANPSPQHVRFDVLAVGDA